MPRKRNKIVGTFKVPTKSFNTYLEEARKKGYRGERAFKVAEENYFKRVYELNKHRITPDAEGDKLTKRQFINSLKHRVGKKSVKETGYTQEKYVSPKQAVKEFSKTRTFVSQEEQGLENIKNNLKGKGALRKAMKEQLGIPKNRKIDWSRFEWDEIEQKYIAKDKNGNIVMGLSFIETDDPYFYGNNIFEIYRPKHGHWVEIKYNEETGAIIK